MPLDWDVYSKETKALIDSNKQELMNNIFDDIKDFIDHQHFFSLGDLIPLMDLERDDFTVRLSWECAFDKKDDRNILFNLTEELEGCDGGDFERLDRLKIIFQNGIATIESKIKELEETWERD